MTVEAAVFPVLPHGKTILGRSRRGTLFHIADEILYPTDQPHEWVSVRWLCGQTVNPQSLAVNVEFPTDGFFGGMDEGEACGRCVQKHNALVLDKLDTAMRSRQEDRQREGTQDE